MRELRDFASPQIHQEYIPLAAISIGNEGEPSAIRCEARVLMIERTSSKLRRATTGGRHAEELSQK